MAQVSSALRKDHLMVYQSWKPHRYVEWKGQREPVEAPRKGIQLAGAWRQIHNRMFCSSPSHVRRCPPVEVERIG